MGQKIQKKDSPKTVSCQSTTTIQGIFCPVFSLLYHMPGFW